jgi:hypothetical protein
MQSRNLRDANISLEARLKSVTHGLARLQDREIFFKVFSPNGDETLHLLLIDDPASVSGNLGFSAELKKTVSDGQIERFKSNNYMTRRRSLHGFTVFQGTRNKTTQSSPIGLGLDIANHPKILCNTRNKEISRVKHEKRMKVIAGKIG